MTLFRFAAVFAIAAVLWRLGDSACGCAAHNRWFEAFAGHHDHGEAGHEAPTDEERSQFDHGCEGANGSSFVTTTSPPQDVPMPAPAFGNVPHACGGAFSVPPPVHGRFEDRPERPSAGKLRAELQIQLV